MPYYAVANGRSKGVYNSWGECESQVKGFSGATFKKFDTREEARSFVSGGSGGAGSSYSSYNNSRRYAPVDYGFTPSTSSSSAKKGNHNFNTDKEGYVEVYTDGACSNNGYKGAQAGLGVYFGDGHPLNCSEPVSGRATNNSGEIQAATKAIRAARSTGVNRLTIKTDSKFLVDSMTKWVDGWQHQGWTLANGEPVKNQADFKDLYDAQKSMDVKWEHVSAHKGIHGNEMADKLAKAGAAKYDK